MKLQNTELICYRFKLKANSEDMVRDWGKKLQSQREEVVKLLKNEGVLIESAFLEHSSEGLFLIYYLRAHDLKKAHEISKASTHPIDEFHKQCMREITESVTILENILDINID